jgi:hypothetical protein
LSALLHATVAAINTMTLSFAAFKRVEGNLCGRMCGLLFAVFQSVSGCFTERPKMVEML